MIIEEHPQTGVYNMQRDEELLELSINKGEVWLRFYQWSEATVSLGYFQRENDVELPPNLVELPRVKRLSGGGAILHDRELTYSIVIPAGHPIAVEPVKLYDIIHARWIEVLNQLGVAVSARGIKAVEKEDEFLCFKRGDARDLLLGEHKIMGSAQRRRKGAILQHGSLLWSHSVHLKELPGITDLSEAQEKYFNKLPEIFCSSPLEQVSGKFLPINE